MNTSTILHSDIEANSQSVSVTKNILIVDDDHAYGHLVSRFVKQKYRNAIVDTCDSSADAIELCLSNQYDILLLSLIHI